MPETPPSERPRRLYFVNAFVDYALIGGISIALYFAMTLLHDGQRTEAVWQTAAMLAWVVNWPHFSATSYRLYHSRSNRRQYPLTAFAIPVLLLAFMAGSFMSPEHVAPSFVKLFLIWSPYHFSGQTLGISLIYARRAGFVVRKWERLALAGFIFSTFLIQTSNAELGSAASQFYSVSTAPLGLPAWVPTLFWALMLSCGATFLLLLTRWSLRSRRLPPPILLLPAITQCVWFVLGSQVASFNEFVPFFHSLQYLLIAWAMQLKEKMDIAGIRPSRSYAWQESARWGAINLAGGAALFWLFPRLCSLSGIEVAFATAVVSSGVQIHHFFVDGVIWKLKNPQVSSPLLVNLGDIIAREPAQGRAAQAASA
jgi:hypothetical protein